ncbi:hypothetical protein PIB30_052279 [Stylosanthes scabra]|uniref:CCHC-type domain-containing protein n=1 Tax=Stylosanthes scabra TaxID=79078 RepID=A0ABU6YGE9_9FABA|nr:hypothetical protein [Stylosanthes scabra]
MRRGINEVETLEALVAQNKTLTQQINLLNSKLGGIQVSVVNSQIDSCDVCGNQGHLSNTCTLIQDQQSTEQVNYMGNAPRPPLNDPYAKTFNRGWRKPSKFWMGWSRKSRIKALQQQFPATTTSCSSHAT